MVRGTIMQVGVGDELSNGTKPPGEGSNDEHDGATARNPAVDTGSVQSPVRARGSLKPLPDDARRR